MVVLAVLLLLLLMLLLMLLLPLTLLGLLLSELAFAAQAAPPAWIPGKLRPALLSHLPLWRAVENVGNPTRPMKTVKAAVQVLYSLLKPAVDGATQYLSQLRSASVRYTWKQKVVMDTTMTVAMNAVLLHRVFMAGQSPWLAWAEELPGDVFKNARIHHRPDDLVCEAGSPCDEGIERRRGGPRDPCRRACRCRACPRPGSAAPAPRVHCPAAQSPEVLQHRAGAFAAP